MKLVMRMKIIRHYKEQRTEVFNWLRSKGYRYKKDFKLEGREMIKGALCDIWRLNIGKEDGNFVSYIIIEERSRSFDIYIIELEEMAGLTAILQFMETGEPVDLSDFIIENKGR